MTSIPKFTLPPIDTYLVEYMRDLIDQRIETVKYVLQDVNYADWLSYHEELDILIAIQGALS